MEISRLSVCTFPFRDRPWPEALEVLAGLGCKQVDLLGRAPHLSLDPDEFDPQGAKDKAAALGLRIANLGTYVGRNFVSEDSAAQEAEFLQLQRAVDLAEFFGARSIRVMPGDDNPDNLHRIVPWFRRAAQYAEGKKVYLGFETHGGGISGSPLRCRELAEEVASPFFGVLYDPCNVMGAGVDFRMALWEMREHLVHVHLKDGAVDVQTGFHRAMLGQGHVDFRWLVEALDYLGYEGHLALEYELPEPPPEQGLRRWLEVAKQI